MTHIKTTDLINLAHSGLDHPEKGVRNAAETALSWAAYNLKQITCRMPPEVEMAADVLREARRADVYDSVR